VHAVVDEYYRDLIRILRAKFFVIENRLFRELDRELWRQFGDDAGDHIPSIVTQMTTGFTDQCKTFRSHNPRIMRMHEVTTPLSRQNAVLAFFDVDNTLMRGASVYYLGKEAWRRGIVGWRDITRFAWQQFRFISVGENHKHMVTARERALAIVGGHSEQTLFELAEQIYERDILPNLWPETVDLTQEHIAKGHEVWLLTATPQFVADVIATRLGLTGALGTRVHARDGVLTGELDGHVIHGSEKATVATELAERLGADLAECWAYSDSSNDIPLLSAVGNRVAVNADAKLRNYAQKMGWQILPLNRADLKEARRRVKRQAKTVRKHGR